LTDQAQSLSAEEYGACSPVELRVVTQDTYREIFELKVAEHQESFVANNMGSFAQAYFHEEARPFGLYANDVAVGFVMFSVEDLDQGTVWVWRLMIAAEHQRKGFGRQAMQAMLTHVRGLEGARELKLSHVDGVPDSPGPFYAALGFEYTGEIEHGERVMRRDLSPLA
jgi:GNAT superfamily N-acetyltransferase